MVAVSGRQVYCASEPKRNLVKGIHSVAHSESPDTLAGLFDLSCQHQAQDGPPCAGCGKSARPESVRGVRSNPYPYRDYSSSWVEVPNFPTSPLSTQAVFYCSFKNP